METIADAAAIALFLAAAATDVTSRKIHNPIVAALVCLGVARIVAGFVLEPSIVSALTDVAVAVAVLAIGACFFALGQLGGGDVKLLAAGALWLGAEVAGHFVVWTILAGGLLALGFLAWSVQRRLRFGRWPPKAMLPYGVAIATGGISLTLVSGI